MTEIADRLGIVPRSLTTVIDSLEAAGLVRREIDPRNRRAILLHLTERGTAVRDELRQARLGAAEDLFAPLPAEDRTTLGRLLAVLDSNQPVLDERADGLVHGGDCAGTLTGRGSDPLHRAGPDVPDREHPGHAGLEWQRPAP